MSICVRCVFIYILHVQNASKNVYLVNIFNEKQIFAYKMQ